MPEVETCGSKISKPGSRKNTDRAGDFGLGSLAVEHLQAGRDIIVTLAATAAASKFSGKIEAFLEEYLLTEEGPGTVPFGGRDEEFERLDHWLVDEKAPSRFVLVAPAGRGKSALLVHWIERLKRQQRIGGGEEP